MPRSTPKQGQKTSAGPPPRTSYESCDSYETYESESTAPTSIYASTQASVKDATPVSKFQPVYEEDISPSTSCCPRSSVDTFDSTLASDEELVRDVEMDGCHDHHEIPQLPVYNHHVVDPNVRPSTPQEFAKLFPSMNRLSIRHDDFTSDGNMNLRVDTVVPGRRRLSMQLFHLRMYDLGKREFSLRRYCRDSGREVCNSKRKYEEPQREARPQIQRSMTSAIKTLGARRPLTRTNSGGSTFSSKSKDHGKRPPTSYSYEADDDEFAEYLNHRSAPSEAAKPKSRRLPTNTIKLEFSNYARVDVSRRGNKNSKRYDFEWWGHRYHWKRVIDKNLGVVSFHLVRDGSSSNNNNPIAHIVPETRSPNQVAVDDEAGGWIPPCYMWISDQTILDAVTDVADVVIATGLVALADDCIKERWQTKKILRLPVPLTSRTLDVENVGPRAFMQNLLQRRASEPHSRSSLRHGHSIVAH